MTGGQVGLELAIDLLRRTGLFANLDAPQLESLAQRMRVHLYPAEQIIFEEGSPGDEFFIITEGKVAITKKVGDDLEILAVLGPDRFFGEMALLEDAPRGAGAVSRTEVGVLTLNRDDRWDDGRKRKTMLPPFPVPHPKRLVPQPTGGAPADILQIHSSQWPFL